MQAPSFHAPSFPFPLLPCLLFILAFTSYWLPFWQNLTQWSTPAAPATLPLPGLFKSPLQGSQPRWSPGEGPRATRNAAAHNSSVLYVHRSSCLPPPIPPIHYMDVPLVRTAIVSRIFSIFLPIFCIFLRRNRGRMARLPPS